MSGSDCVVQVNNIQRMIDINASNLYGLRTQCTTTSDLIQQEIRDQEAKLVKLFSRLLVARQQIDAEYTDNSDFCQYPRLEQWLHVVGIGPNGIQNLVGKYGSFGSLLAAPEHKLKSVLVESNASDKDTWKLISALNNLRQLTEQRKEGKNNLTGTTYSWSYGKETPHLNSSSSSSQSSIVRNDEISPTPKPDHVNGERSNGMKRAFIHPVNIKRSKSDELARKPNLEALCLSPGGSLGKNKGRNLWITIPKGSMDHLNNDKPDDCSIGSNNSNSPKTPTRINLGDKHKFSHKHVMLGSHCFLCNKQIFRGVKCKQCGLRLHKKCYNNAPALNGCAFVRTTMTITRNNKYYGSLPHRWKRTNSEPTSIANQLSNPVEHARLPFNTSHGDLFQNTDTHRSRGFGEPPIKFSYGHHLLSSVFTADAGSMSSVTSTPQSSPPGSISIPVPASAPPQGDGDVYDRRVFASRSVRRRKGLGVFLFPDNVNIDPLDDESDFDGAETPLVRTDSIQSGQSTITVQSSDSTISGDDTPTVDSLESQISDYDSLTRTWSSKKWARDSHLSEWTIPFNDIDLQDRIGVGRIGEVYRGNWHGQVAVKVIDIQQPTVAQLQAFKIQVQTICKTRHENLVLFMGACMEPPKLAIITSLCKDSHLYKRIHVFKETLPAPKVMLILKQIAQGMSYLHSRGIIHADLKSKNIFFENDSKVVITDFGHLRLAAGLSVEKTRVGTVRIPFGWLNYLAPEIICSLSPYQKLFKRMFTKESDVYAFGTLCYELLSGSWPFTDFPLETIIYKVGKGHKQSLSKLDVTREMKDIINMFWAYYPGKRPHFKNIAKILDKIPVTKGRLYRSPSQPVTHMIRTLEVNSF